MLDRLIRALSEFSADMDAMSVADTLWLAQAMQPERVATPPEPPDMTPSPPSSVPESKPPPREPPHLPEPEPLDEDNVVADVQDDTGARRGARAEVPTGRALAGTLDIARALRPFKQRFLNFARLELSVDETIEQYVATNRLSPVLLPAKERWFDVDLVVDCSASMAAWDDTVAEIMNVLRRTSAFRTVAKWRIDPDEPEPLLRKAKDITLKPRALRDPRQRRLVIVVSDCVAEGWHREEIWSILRDWASATHTMLLNPLPQRLWRRTGLDHPAGRLRSVRPGAPNRSLKFGVSSLLRKETGVDRWLPLPVAGLSAASLGQWSRTAMAKDPAGCDGVLLPLEGKLSFEDDGRLDEGPPDGEELVESFRLFASGAAWRIAVLCADQDVIYVRVLRFIQRELVPDAEPADLAEVLSSGLFHEAVGSKPEELILALRAGVGDHLKTYASTLDTWTLVNTLTDYVRAESSTHGRVDAVVLDGTGDLPVSEHLKPFVRAARNAAASLESPAEPAVEPEPLQPLPPLVGQAMVRGRFVGIGVSSYELAPPLEQAVIGVQAFGSLLEDYESRSLIDPTEAEVRAHMRSLTSDPQDGGALVAMWSGHAVPVAGNLRLLARDNDGAVDGISLHEFALWCTASGANQVLIIIDACYAGALLDEAVRTISALQDEMLADQVHWVGVLVSCSSLDVARDGLFGDRLRRLLKLGPTMEEDAWRWSDRTWLIGGGVFGAALLNSWDDNLQRPRFLQYGSSQPMLPNPLRGPGGIVKHLLLAARGGDSPNGRSWFSGRTREVNRVVRWVESRVPGIRVVTGSPGTGKSALVGRVVSLSDRRERARLHNSGSTWLHDDPGENSVAANVHARAMDANRLADVISREMVAYRLIPPPAGPRRDAVELVGVLARRTGPPPVVVVDGLDEARGESFSIATTLLVPLARYCVVMVSTRQVQAAAGGAPLLTELSPVEVINLDDSDNEADVRAYVLARLGSSVPPSTVEEIARLPFLSAWMLTDQVLAGGDADVALSLDAAFERDLVRVPSARALLTALTWSYGAGFPEPEWIAVAEALSGAAFHSADVSAVLAELGHHVVRDSEEGAAVFKLTHQTFSDYLRSPFAPSRDDVFAPGSDKVAAALVWMYRKRLEAGVPADAPGYLRKYAWRHCASAGLHTLDRLRELATMDRTLLPDLALAATSVANELAHWGRGDEAIAPLEEAAKHFRALVSVNRVYLANLAYVLNRLGQRYREAGRLQQAVAPAEEAVMRYRELAAAAPTTAEATTHKRLAQRIAKTTTRAGDAVTYATQLSGALVDLSEIYMMLGRRHEALSTARDAVAAVDAHGSLAADGPVARAMSCLAAGCRESGRRYEAMQRSKQAVELYYALSQTNPVVLADLVHALVDLSRDYLALGRLSEAGNATQQGADISGTLGRHAAFRPQLTAAALSLSVAYSMIDRADEALTAARQAADLADGLPVHGEALHNLMRRQRDANKDREALATGLRAVEVCLLPESRGQTSTLAGVLFTLDTICVRLRQPEILDETWNRVRCRLTGPGLATLLMLRAAAAQAGDPQAVEWLHEAVVHARHRGAINDVHDVTRRHFDAGSPWPWPIADWLTVDRGLLATARAWVHARSYAEERALLLEHPELLTDAADVAVTEALYGVILEEAQTVQSRRQTAQEQGVEAAYRPWLLVSLADEFVDATPARRRELLATRREDLVSGEVDSAVHNPQVRALLVLARTDESGLEAALLAQENPASAGRILRHVATSAEPWVLDSVLAAVGPYPDEPLHRAVARMLAGDIDGARQVLQDAEQASRWIDELTWLVRSRPELAPLIRMVSDPA